jgi:hypothetical protein
MAAASTLGLVRCTPGIGAFIASPRITYSLASDARFYENVLRAVRDQAGDGSHRTTGIVGWQRDA